MIPYLRTLLFDLNRMAGASEKVKRGLAVLRSFIGAVKLTVHDIPIGIDIDPEEGSADSGDLEIDLPDLFTAIGEAAEDRKCAVAILIDAIQYFNQKDLSALIVAMQCSSNNFLWFSMIYSPTYGEIAFTVPLFDGFMIRAIPELKSPG